jgi:hypothetical protein
VTDRLLLEVAGRLLSQSADGVTARKTAGTACSLNGSHKSPPISRCHW